MPKRDSDGAAVGRTKPKRGSPPPPTRSVKRRIKPGDAEDPLIDQAIRNKMNQRPIASVLEDLGLLPQWGDEGIKRPAMAEEIDPDMLDAWPSIDQWGLQEEAESGGMEGPPINRLWDLRGYRPEEYPEDNILNAERIKGTDPRVREATDRIGRGDLPDRGKIKDAHERGLPDEWPEDEAVNNDFAERLRRLMLDRRDIEVSDNLLELGPKFDVAGGLMDLLQTPGFKIGLGGTAALMGLLSYLGANVAEEVLP